MAFSMSQFRGFLDRNFCIHPDFVSLASHLDRDLHLEIWEKVELILYLETTYGVEFPADATRRFTTIFELVAFVTLSGWWVRPTKPFVFDEN